MKLRGSLAEKNERENLRASNAYLRDGRHRVSVVLRAHGVDLATAYVLEHTPDQGEDFFVILVAGNQVINLEVPQEEKATPVVQTVPLSEYRPRGRPAQIRLAIALELAKRSPGSDVA